MENLLVLWNVNLKVSSMILEMRGATTVVLSRVILSSIGSNHPKPSEVNTDLIIIGGVDAGMIISV